MRGRYERMDQQRGPLQLGYPAEAHETGLVAVSCGHSMHVACFHTYLQSTEQRHAMQVARNHPEDLSRFEYVCPLCKSLGNMLLPQPGVSGLSSSAVFHADGARFGSITPSETPLSEWVRTANIAILKDTPADTTVYTDYQDMSHGSGCFLPWLVMGSLQPHNPDLGVDFYAADECHMLQRLSLIHISEPTRPY